MDRTAWIVVVTCVVLLFAWPSLMEKMYPAPEVPPVKEGGALTERSVASEADIVEGESIQSSVPSLLPSSEVVVEGDIGDAKEYVLENKHIEVVLTTFGGGIARIGLKDHYIVEEGDLIILHGTGDIPLLNLQGPDWTGGYSIVPFEVVKATQSQVIFERSLAKGGKLQRVFTLDPEHDYLVHLEQQVVNDGDDLLVLGPARIDTGVAEPIHGRGDERTHLKVGWKDAAGNFVSKAITTFDSFSLLGITFSEGESVVKSSEDQDLLWAFTKSQFFALVVDFSNTSGVSELRGTRVELPHLRAKNEKIPDGIRASVQLDGVKVRPGEMVKREVTLYAGPKFDKLMTSIDKLEVMEFGFFGFVSRPLLLFMNWIHGFVGNYGWAIVIMTIVIKLALWYPQTKANLSMKKMQVVAPVMKELQEKYKGKPEKLNEEMMKIYGDYGVNPLGGCLPMLLQMPIFIGFYWMLQGAIELRHEGWVWWVHDLSQPDTVGYLPLPGLGEFPINPLPVLMSVTMFLSFQLSPKPQGVDNPMQHMFKFLPILFLFICYNFASALSLYWTIQNLLGMVQMYFNLKVPVPTPEELKAQAAEKKKFREELKAKGADPGATAPPKKARGPRTQKRKKR